MQGDHFIMQTCVIQRKTVLDGGCFRDEVALLGSHLFQKQYHSRNRRNTQQHGNNNNCIQMVFTMKGCPHELYPL